MSKHLSFVLLASSCMYLTTLHAQNWVNGGNTLAADGRLGTNNAFALVFETNNTERGRITNSGIWSIGTTPKTAKFTVNSVAGQHSLRAMVAEATKLIVNSNGGTTIGGGTTVGPANGLYVSGSVGIGTATPAYKLHVEGSGLFTTGVIVSNGSVSSSNSYGTAIYGSSSSSYGIRANSTSSYGIYATSGYVAVYGEGTSYGLYGHSTNNYGVNGNSTNNTGVSGNGGTYGVRGFSSGGLGVYGSSNDGSGVYGLSTNRKGGYFVSTNEIALWARTGRTDKNWAGVFEGNVYTYNSYVTSDKNLKKNIEDFGDALSIVNKLKPKSYEFRMDGKLANMNLPKGKHFGVLAQDLEEVLPNLVMEVENEVSPIANSVPAATTPSSGGNTPAAVTPPGESAEKITLKAVNYTELIPVMLKAIQELSTKNETLQQQVDDLKQTIMKLQQGGTTGAPYFSMLGQNHPNPVSGTTNIQYTIPEGSYRPHLLITDALGRQIKAVQLSTSGTINVDVSTLASGVYNYSLIINNKTINTRKMTVIK